MAHGSLGEMVLSRLNGQQVARVRNRQPRNPRSNKQLYQRAIMATVMRAYTAGREIFDHSFERYTRGAQCQHRFFARNCSQLRSLLAADLDSGTGYISQRTMFGAPGINSPTPSPYIISEGSLPEGMLAQDPGASTTYGYIGMPRKYDNYINPHGVNTYATFVNSIMSANLLDPDDILTICWFAEDFTSLPEFEIRDRNNGYSKQYPGGFGYVRLGFNENVLENTNTFDIEPKIIGDGTSGANGGIFKITSYAGYEAATAANRLIESNILSTFNLNNMLLPAGSLSYIYGGFIGVIHSKRDTNLRNNSTMVYSATANNVAAPFGIVSGLILQAWRQGTESVGLSDAILES